MREAEAAGEKSLYRIEQHSQGNNQDPARSGQFAPFYPRSVTNEAIAAPRV